MHRFITLTLFCQQIPLLTSSREKCEVFEKCRKDLTNIGRRGEYWAERVEDVRCPRCSNVHYARGLHIFLSIGLKIAFSTVVAAFETRFSSSSGRQSTVPAKQQKA